MIAIDGWRAAGAIAPAIGQERPHRRGPLLRAILHVQGDKRFGVSARPHRIERGTDHRKAGISQAGVLIDPERLWPAIGPLLEKAGFFGDIGSIRPPPLRPAFGLDEGQTGEGACQKCRDCKGVKGLHVYSFRWLMCSLIPVECTGWQIVSS